MALKKCIKCGEEKTIANFIGCNSPLHTGSLPICRTCIDKIIAAAPDDKRWNQVDKLCQWADVPFVPAQWQKIYDGGAKDAFGRYMSIFRNEKYETLDWGMYNDVYLKLQEEHRVEDAIPELREEQFRKLRNKWGPNYDDGELEYLENLHQGLLESQNIVGALNEDQALKLCKISLIIEQKIRERADFSKDLRAYDDLSKLANITPKSVKDANEFNSVGELMAYLEKTGFVNKYYDGAVRDEVDFCIKDIKYWLQYLYVNESGVADEIELRINNLKTSAAMTGGTFNEDEFRQYMKEQGSSPITEEDFEVDI